MCFGSHSSADFVCKEIIIEHRSHKVHIWDTAGQETYHSITAPYFRNANGILLFFDLTDRQSFDSLGYWFDLITENTRTLPPIVVLGNKCDRLDRCTSTQAAKDFCDRMHVDYMETSALEGINVEEAVIALIRKLSHTEHKLPASVALKPVSDMPRKSAEQDCC